MNPPDLTLVLPGGSRVKTYLTFATLGSPVLDSVTGIIGWVCLVFIHCPGHTKKGHKSLPAILIINEQHWIKQKKMSILVGPGPLGVLADALKKKTNGGVLTRGRKQALDHSELLQSVDDILSNQGHNARIMAENIKKKGEDLWEMFWREVAEGQDVEILHAHLLAFGRTLEVLINTPLSDSQFEAVCSALRLHGNVAALSILTVPLTERMEKALKTLLANIPRLDSLHLGSPVSTRLLQRIAQTETLRSISLRNADEEAVLTVLKNIGHSMGSVLLYVKTISDATVEAIASAREKRLQTKISLIDVEEWPSELVLNSTLCATTVYVTEKLREPTPALVITSDSLRLFYMTTTHIEPENLLHIKKSSSVRELHVFHWDNAEAASLISENQHIEMFQIAFMLKGSLEPVFSAVSRKQTLQCFRIAHIEFSEEDLSVFQRFLEENRTLKKLILDDCEPFSDIVECLFGALTTNTWLNVDVGISSDEDISDDQWERIKELQDTLTTPTRKVKFLA